jgi:hypothetical protein
MRWRRIMVISQCSIHTQQHVYFIGVAYILGGYVASANNTFALDDTVEIYNATTNVWTLATMKLAKAAARFSAVAFGCSVCSVCFIYLFILDAPAPVSATTVAPSVATTTAKGVFIFRLFSINIVIAFKVAHALAHFFRWLLLELLYV